MRELGHYRLVAWNICRIRGRKNKSEVEYELIAWVVLPFDADRIRYDCAGWIVWTERWWSETDEIAAQRLPRDQKPGDR